MIHATFADGETALFEPSELVDTCEWISDDGEYFDNPVTNYAYLAIKPGVYLLERTSDGKLPQSRIASAISQNRQLFQKAVGRNWKLADTK